MTHANEDVNRILEYLQKNDQDLDGVNAKGGKMDIYNQDGLLVSTIWWHNRGNTIYW